MKGRFFCYAFRLEGCTPEGLAKWVEETFNRHPKFAEWFTEEVGGFYLVGIWEG